MAQLQCRRADGRSMSADVDKSRQRMLGAFLMTLCAMSYAVMSATTHQSGKYVPSAEIALVRFSCQIVICLIWSFVARPNVRGINSFWLSVRGISGACAILCLFYGLTLVPVGDGIALYSLYPIWASIIAWRFMGESFGIGLACSLFFCIGGTALIAFAQRHLSGSAGSGQFGGWTQHQAHGYIAIVVGSMFASMEIISCRLLTDANAIFLTASVSIMGSLASASKLAFDGNIVNITSLPSEALASLGGVCLSGFVAVQLLNTSAQLLEAGPVTVIGASEIVWAYLLQVWMFDEVPRCLVTIGAILVVFGAMLPGLQRGRPSGQSEMSHDLLIDCDRM